MADIFLSYAAEDRDRVRPLVATLEQHGWTVWWDRDIPPGMTWDEVLERELHQVKCVLVAWSEHAARSRWVKIEAMEALERDRLVPVRLDSTVLPLGFRHVHASDLPSARELPDTLVERLRALVGARAVETKHPSLAVLPFTNLSGDPSQEYFADGFTEALIKSLAQIGALKVISRTSVMRFKNHGGALRQIARELDVTKVVEGSVLTSGKRVRITAQLIDGESDTHEWAESFDRDLTDVLAVHDEIARLVAEQVSVRLTPRETARLSSPRRVDPDAHDRYLRGLQLVHRLQPNEVRQGIALFEESLRIDPQLALAHAGIASALNEALRWGELFELVEDLDRPRRAAMAALMIDPELADAHLALAGVEQNAWNWPRAERAFTTALSLNPNFAEAYRDYGLFLIVVGRPTEAIEASRRSVELEPLSARFADDFGRTFYRAGRYTEAIEQHRRALELDPTYVPPHMRIVEAMLELRQFEEVERQLPKNRFGSRLIVGHLAARRGQRDEARAIAERLATVSSPWATLTVIELHTLIGELDKAMALLERAVIARSIVPYMLRNPSLLPLRSHPRFRRLMQLIGLPV